MEKAKQIGRTKQVSQKKQAKQKKRTEPSTQSKLGKRSKQAKQAPGGKQRGQARTSRRASQNKGTAHSRQAPRKRKTPLPRVEPEDFLTQSVDIGSHGAASGGAQVGKRSLGERIREARDMRGLTLEDLSSRSGILVDTLERVESNRGIPPLGELIRLGKALEMKMGYFISAGVDRPMTVVRSGSRRTVARRGKEMSEQYGYVYESLAPEKADRLMEPFLVTLIPTDFGELSNHDGQEFIFVLEGRIRAQVGKEVEILHPGDSIYYDSFHPHLVKCHGKKPAKILAVIHAGAQ